VNRIRLARLAVTETGMGVLEDKVIKNHFASEYIYNKYKEVKTCGVIEEDAAYGYREVGAPIGVIAGVIPTTNPTSTAIFKSLISLKTRNAIIFTPPPRAGPSTNEPPGSSTTRPWPPGPQGHRGLDRHTDHRTHRAAHAASGRQPILATGGPGMVHAAYSSGKPAIGVGAGNTPVVVDATANIKMAVSSIIMSKTFDNGMILRLGTVGHRGGLRGRGGQAEFVLRGCLFATEEQKAALAGDNLHGRPLNPAIVGQSAAKIADWPESRWTRRSRSSSPSARPSMPPTPSPTRSFPGPGLLPGRKLRAGRGHAQELIILGGAGHTSCCTPARPTRTVSSISRGHDLRPDPDQHALVPGGHRRRLQLPPGPIVDPWLRFLGRQFRERNIG
jgi:acetaldehyde dehydrogenase/alcohol dehydrogenase